MIITEVINNSGVIKLNRADKRNALNPELTKALRDILASYKENNNVKSIIITGEGKAFCAGADLEYLLSLRDSSIIENREDSENIARLFLDLHNYPKPLIAAVNGAAIAGGCGLASVCDYVAAHSQYAKFGYSEVKIGFIPAIVSIFLIRRIGVVKAKQLLISAEIIEAETALKIGLADYLSDDPLTAAYEIASRLNQNSLSSIMMTKKMINTISTLPVNEAIDYCVELNTISRYAEDFINGLNSFFRKQD
jgi:methylglutaconyl-CoA hydratase